MTNINELKELSEKLQQEQRKREREQIEKAQLQIVVKSNKLIQDTRYELGTQEQKLIIYLVSLIKPNYEDFKDFRVDIKELCKVLGLQEQRQNYVDLKKALKGLADKSFWITTPERDFLIRWLERIEIDKTQTQVICRFDERLKPHLLKLRESFTSYQLCYVLALKSKYAIRMYELFHSYLFRREFDLTLEELKSLLKIQNKYNEFSELKRNVIEKAVDEINGFTDIYVDYKPFREGKKIVGVRFTLSQQADAQSQQIALEQISLDEV